MAMLSINWKPTSRELRWFSGLLIVFFGVVAGVWCLRSGQTTGPAILFGATSALGVLGLAVPSAVRWVYVGWMVAVWPIGCAISYLLLAGIFYGVITPIGLCLRLLGRDPMRKALDRTATTYWIPRSPEEPDASRYFRQF
jgi:saxitoxin biosynthesis operon SxtJ-like protein